MKACETIKCKVWLEKGTTHVGNNHVGRKRIEEEKEDGRSRRERESLGILSKTLSLKLSAVDEEEEQH